MSSNRSILTGRKTYPFLFLLILLGALIYGTVPAIYGQVDLEVVSMDRADSLMKEAAQKRNAGDYMEAEDLIGRTLSLVRMSHDQKREILALQQLGIIHIYNAEYGKAASVLQQSLEIARESGLLSLESRANFNLGFNLECRGEFQESLEFYKSAEQLARQAADDTLLANVLIRSGNAYRMVSDYENAADYFEQAEQIYTRLQIKSGMIRLFKLKGIFYKDLGKNEQAVNYFFRALNLIEESDQRARSRLFGLIGGTYFSQGKYDSALVYTQTALKMRQELSDTVGIASSYTSLGKQYLKKAELDKALQSFQKSLDLRVHLGGYYGLAETMHNIGVVYLLQKNSEQAERYLRRSLAMSKEKNFLPLERDNYHQLALLYEMQGDYNSALNTYKKFETIKDSLFEVTNTRRMTTLLIKSKTEMVEKELAALKKAKVQQDRLRQMYVIIVVLSVVMLLITLVFYRTKSKTSKFLKSVIHSNTNPFFVVDAQTYKTELTNNSADTIQSELMKQLLQKDVSEKGNWIEQIKKSKSAQVREIKLLNTEDDEKYLEVYGFPFYDIRGNVSKVIVHGIDITARIRAQQKLQDNQQALKAAKDKFEQVIATIPDAIWSATINEYGSICNSFYSPVIETITGYPAAHFEASEKNWSQIVHPEDLPKLRSRNAEIFTDNKAQTRLEYRIIRKDGSVRHLNSSIRFTHLDNGMQRADGVLTDITEQKKIEQELFNAKKLESIGVLAGGIAHDFNNILTAISGNISLASMLAGAQNKAVERLDEAEKACVRARDLTQQLLTFSRGGSPVKQTASLGELIRESVAFILTGTSVRAEFDISDDLWLCDVDEGQITQVFYNLLINARQAMPEGGIIHLKARNFQNNGSAGTSLKDDRYVRIDVEDSGVGISPGHISKIFDPYFTTKQDGSGLGLAVCYSIIKKHDGHIQVSSKQGQGTTFQLYLPASDKRTIEREDKDKSLPALKGRVLLMDDEEVILDVAGAMLRHLGLEVVYSRNGQEAIKLYRESLNGGEEINLVILDLTIPGGMGGKDAIDQLRKIDPEIKALVSSGYSNDPVMSDYASHGFDGIIAKPYKLEELGQILCKMLNVPREIVS